MPETFDRPFEDPDLLPEAPEHLAPADLHYDPNQTRERHEVPFEPVVLERYPDGRPKRGICGRNEHGGIVVPPNAISETMTGKDLHDDRIATELANKGLQHWHMFENPDAHTLQEQTDWRDEATG